MVNEIVVDRAAVMQRLLERVEDEAGLGTARDPPADDPSRESVDHEGHVNEAGPGRDIAEVGDPERIRPADLEVSVDPIERTGCGLVAVRGALRSSPDDALQPHLAHQPGDRAACDLDPFAAELAPHLAHAVDAEVVLEDAPDLTAELGVAPGARRDLGRIGTARHVGVIGRRGDRQHPADRLDPVDGTVLVDERDHGLDRRSSSAWAKYALAFLRISLACLSSRFSRSSVLIRSRSSSKPSHRPASRSARRSHSRSVSALQPIFAATERTAAARDGWSASCS
jgi:hypothetical protein